jgi:hypothetical protein
LNRRTLQGALNKLATSKVAGDKHSMLANLITGIQRHNNISFSALDFKDAFLTMRTVKGAERKAIDKKLLSNTGRTLAQSFQGKVDSDHITAMEINGSTIYFRGECTNVLTVNEPLQTTITSAKSVPVAIPVSIGGGNAPEGLVNSSRPELEGDATDIFTPKRTF